MGWGTHIWRLISPNLKLNLMSLWHGFVWFDSPYGPIQSTFFIQLFSEIGHNCKNANIYSPACPFLCGKPPLKLKSTNTYGPQLFWPCTCLTWLTWLWVLHFLTRQKFPQPFWVKFFYGNENCLSKRMGNQFISITSHNRHCSSANHLLEMA